MAMKIEGGGSPSPPPQTDATKTTESVKQTESQTQSTATTSTPQEATKTPTTPYNATGQLAEHNISGQARAAQLKDAAAGGATAGAGQAAPTAEAKPLSQGSKGPEVEAAQKQINQWRAENGKKPIKEDGKFETETEKAVLDFQKANGLKTDCIIGGNTRDRLALETDSNFKGLSDPSKKQVRDQMNSYSKDKTSRENLKQLATDPNLSKLSPELQDQALKKLAGSPKDPAVLKNIQENVKDRATLETNANFQKLNDATKKTIRDTMEKSPDHPIVREHLTKMSTDPNFGKLSPAHQDQLLKALEKNPTEVSNLKNMQKMIGSESFQKMDDALKTRTLDLAAKNATNYKYVEDLSKLTSDPKFGKLSTQDKGKTLNVFENTTPDGRIALQGLMQREINGVPAITSSGVGKTGSLLDQLNRLSTTPLDARMVDRSGKAIDRAKVSEQLLQEVSNPSNYIDQSNRGTCTCTSMSHRLASKNPAEYARLATDLATTGQTKLANGDTINVPGNSAWLPDSSGRSHTERLVQSSLMDYARPGKGYVNHNNGPDGAYGTADDGFVPDPSQPLQKNPDGWTDRPGSGLTSDEEKRVLKGLYGKSFDFYTGSLNFQDDKKDISNKVESEIKAGRGPINVDLSWGSGGHAVEVTEIKDGRVYIRNPWGGGNIGPTGQINGTAANNNGTGPLRKVENGADGVESMTIADFRASVRGAYIED